MQIRLCRGALDRLTQIREAFRRLSLREQRSGERLEGFDVGRIDGEAGPAYGSGFRVPPV